MARTHPKPADTFLIGKDLPDLQQLLGPKVPAFRAKQVYEALYRQNIADLSEATMLPDSLRADLAANENLGRLEIENRFSSSDGTTRYLLKLPLDGRTVETVLMPEETRHTICISTQVGCPVDCKFCLTAAMGLERNLTVGEIVGQVLVLIREHNLDPRSEQLNLVLMGMGEPLLNLDNVLKAIRILCDHRGVSMAQRRIAISTSGIIPKIEELGRADIRPRLAISLNASSDEQRREIMPITRKYPLKDLIQACHNYPLKPREKLMFEYVLLGGVNDSEADAHRVVKLLANLKAVVNLIALNPGPGIPFAMPSEENVNAFQRIVMKSIPCYVRKPRGRDIYAACGQLKRTVAGTGYHFLSCCCGILTADMKSRTLLFLAISALPLAAQQPATPARQPMSFFVTSVPVGNGANLGGLAGADKHCQQLAAAGGAGNRTWHAYLSATGVNARDRIGQGPWYNAKGARVAQNLGDLHGDTLDQARVGNTLTRATALTEKGDAVKGFGDTPNQHDILTGSQPDGRAYTDAADHTCKNWTSNGEGTAQLGHFDRTGGPNVSWNSTHPSRGCSQENLVSTGGAGLLYCFAPGN